MKRRFALLHPLTAGCGTWPTSQLSASSQLSGVQRASGKSAENDANDHGGHGHGGLNRVG
jgi:hypothetical protein